jgi:hypothetical protein
MQKKRKETFLPPILSLPAATVPVCSWLAIKKKEWHKHRTINLNKNKAYDFTVHHAILEAGNE